MYGHRFLTLAAVDWARPLLHILLDAVFPPKCLVCSRFYKPAITGPATARPAPAEGQINDASPRAYRLLTPYCCPDCINSFVAISAPICTCCGIMFKSRGDENHICEDCIRQPKNYRMARAAMAYDHELMAVIHRFKYAGKIQLARPLGGLALSAYMRHWDRQEVDLVVPVPLHAKKFRRRGFNQSYLLTLGWNAIYEVPQPVFLKNWVSTDILIRSRETVSQTGLNRRQRLKNIKGAFRVRFPEKVRAKKILLVDDVYTTGATVNECARVLLAAGAQMVDVLTVARSM